MPLPEARQGQMEDAAFWELGLMRRSPVDRRAVYGWPLLGDRDPDDIGVPIRKGSRDLVTAIRALGGRQHLKMSHDDRVRVNDGPWMEAVQPSRDRPALADEGFVCRPENGHKLRVVEPSNGVDRPPGTFDKPWMRRADGWVSEGEVCCLEVVWDDERRG